MRTESPLWQQDDPDRLIVWQPASPPRAVEGPLALTCFAGRRLVLELAPAQIVCRESGGRLRQVYFDGVHRLEIGEGEHQIAPDNRLTFLRPDAPLDLRWRQNDSLVLAVAAAGRPQPQPGDPSGASPSGLRLPLRGLCRLHLAEPLLFYRSLLEGLDRAASGDLLAVLDALVRTHLTEHLRPLLRGKDLDRLHAQALLADLGPNDLAEDLAEVGLGCLQLAAFLPLDSEERRAETATCPVGPGTYDDLL